MKIYTTDYPDKYHVTVDNDYGPHSHYLVNISTGYAEAVLYPGLGRELSIAEIEYHSLKERITTYMLADLFQKIEKLTLLEERVERIYNKLTQTFNGFY